MTNNPTIDGVSRAKIESLIERYENVSVPGLLSAAIVADQLRALLDAPVVERQPALLGYRIETEHGHHFKDSPTRGMGINCIELTDRAEVAALQSTIARLEARIAELESGRDEPVCYQARHSAEEPWFFTDKPGYREWRPLFTAPTAPVAVVLPDRLRPEHWMSHGWNACLDATAALNGPAK